MIISRTFHINSTYLNGDNVTCSYVYVLCKIVMQSHLYSEAEFFAVWYLCSTLPWKLSDICFTKLYDSRKTHQCVRERERERESSVCLRLPWQHRNMGWIKDYFKLLGL